MGWFRKGKSVPLEEFIEAPEDVPAEPVEPAEEASPPPWPEGRYEGRLTSVNATQDQGAGLVAAEGEWAGYHVRWAGNGQYVFVEQGGLTHNEVHHQRYVSVASASVSDPHFYEAQPGDAHYDETAPRKTTPRRLPDKEAPYQTGHTISDRDVV